MKLKRILICSVMVFILWGCSMGMESHTTFQSDGAGEVGITYRWPRIFTAAMNALAEDGFTFVDEAASRERAAEVDGVEFQSASQWDSFLRSYYEEVYSFDTLEDFSRMESSMLISATLERSQDQWTYSQMLYSGWVKSKEQDLAVDFLMGSLLKKMKMTYRVESPNPITFHSLGRRSFDRRSVTYRTSMQDIWDLDEELYFDVQW